MIKNLLSLAATTAIFGSGAYLYIAYQTHKNRHEYQEFLKAETLRDASRLTNDSFGISWGFQADDTIMKRVDSGDMVFMKYDCSECLSPS